MKTSRLGFAGLFSILVLSACGGGGGSDSSPNPTPNPTPNPAPAPTPPPSPTALQILSDPLKHPKATLDDAAKSVADASYAGETKVATAAAVICNVLRKANYPDKLKGRLAGLASIEVALASAERN